MSSGTTLDDSTSTTNRLAPELLPDRALEFCRAPHSFLLNLCRTEGPIARFRLNHETFAVLGDPDAIHAVFNGSMDDFEKGELYDLVEAVFGESVFTIDGPEWTDLHEALTPLFSRNRVNALAPVVCSVVERHIEQWSRLSEAGEPVDLLTDAKRLAFNVVARGLIGIEDDTAADRLFAVLHKADRVEGVRLKYLGKRVPAIRSHFRQNPLAEETDRVAYAIAHQRIAASQPASAQESDLIVSAIASPFCLPSGRRRGIEYPDASATLKR